MKKDTIYRSLHSNKAPYTKKKEVTFNCNIILFLSYNSFLAVKKCSIYEINSLYSSQIFKERFNYLISLKKSPYARMKVLLHLT